jgi:hypothetical protein
MALVTSLVLACAVCGAAEKTLPANGAEVPFDGRKRATLELRAASFATSDRALHIVELRAQPGVAVAIGRDTLVGGEVPLLRRTLEAEGGERPQASGLRPQAGDRTSTSTSTRMSVGDVELRATHTAWRSVPATTNRRLTIAAGVKLPTAPLERDPAGALMHPDLQPGCGSIVPLVGGSYVWTSSLWSAWASTSLLFPVSVRSGAHPGDSLRGSLGMQLQPSRILATRLGVHGRLDGTGELDGEVVRSSGGASVHVAPELVLSPTQDVVVALGASFPVVQEMRGYRATTPVLLASVGVDF